MSDAAQAPDTPLDSDTPSREPGERRQIVKPRLFDRKWLQRTVFAVSSLIPLILVAHLADAHDSAVTAISTALIFAILVLLYVIVESFDPGSLWPLPMRTVNGYVLKLLACLHAIGAIYIVCQKQAESLPLADVPEFLVWMVCGYCWLIAPLAFLVGDAQLRRRDP